MSKKILLLLGVMFAFAAQGEVQAAGKPSPKIVKKSVASDAKPVTTPAAALAAADTAAPETKQAPSADSAELASVRTKLNAAYPRVQVTEIQKVEVPGLYEVEAGDNILYYYPDKELIFFGEIYTKEGKSLTAERRAGLVEKKLAQMPLEQAIKIGNGPNTVIEFTDTDCPFCRKAFEWFKNRNDVTKYVFLTPIAQLHPKAVEKAQYIMSQKDKVAAYNDAMSGKLDNRTLEGITDEGKRLADSHKSLGTKVGLNGTPLFFVNGKMVNGANFQAIEQNLKK